MTRQPAMRISCIGVNHRTAPIEVREQLWLSVDQMRRMLPALRYRAVDECVLISTCNRTELYYVPNERSAEGEVTRELLACFPGLDESVFRDRSYHLHSAIAAYHLLKLVSGIDSMVLGDVQIVNQVKTAFSVAQEERTVGALLSRLFTSALHTGKRVRSETEIGAGAVSVGYAAAELCSRIYSDLAQRSALLIGAGETALLTAKHLHGQGLGKLLVTNRTRGRAELLARDLAGTVVDFDSFRNVLSEIDIIIASVHASDHVLNRSDLRAAMRARSGKPQVVIDLGIPRNIDPTARTIENVFLSDIDTLSLVVDRNLEKRTSEIPKAQQIIRDELTQFYSWHAARQVAPTIQDLRNYFEEIRRTEFDRCCNQFDARVRAEVSLVTKRIINKILHTPAVNLRAQSERGGNAIGAIKVLRSLFSFHAGISG